MSHGLPPLPPRTLRFLPLGGLGEIGMNMMAVEYEGSIVIIDCGQTLPDQSMPGVDVVIPDVAVLRERRKDVVGMVITHGHEDHIGAVPYIIPKFNVPMFAPRLATELIKHKMSEVRPPVNYSLTMVTPDKPIKLGPFEVSWVRVTHSTPDTFALVLRTPIGIVVWSGDFKIDPNGLGESIFDVHAFAKLGQEGVLALFCDSTNAGSEGVSGHEIDLIEPLDLIFWEASSGAIVLSTFSSSIHRIQTVMDLAAEHGRKVHVAGRSMGNVTNICSRLGLLHAPEPVVADPAEFMKLPANKRLLVCSGCQGEPSSALSRMSLGDHRQLSVNEGDTVILSARMIPGNETPIFNMVNHFYRRGSRVLTEHDAKVHVSGHAYRQEIKQLISLIRPKHLVPIHGELRHLMAGRSIGRDMGVPEQRIHLMDRGDALDLNTEDARIVGHLPISRVMVDGRGLDNLNDIVLRDRQHLSEDGMIVIILAVDSAKGAIVTGPELATRGFIHEGEGEAILDECRKVVLTAFEEMDKPARKEANLVSDAVRKGLKRHLAKEYDRHPLILPTILEI